MLTLNLQKYWLTGSVKLLNYRPHGQHVVVLTEDAPRYADYRSERSDPGQIVSGSRQIYLTFPAESTFTEEDVSNYFRYVGMAAAKEMP